MRVGQEYFKIDSSFWAMEKDFALVAKKLMQNQKLMKLLYYTQPDCLKGEDLTDVQIYEMIGKHIRIVPKLDIQKECPIYVVITFNDFLPNSSNPQFRDCTLSFDILCHPDHWNLGNFELRPYKIAGLIDATINNQKLTGIGTAQFSSAHNLVLNDQLMGLTMNYDIIHGVEDVLPVE